MTMSTYEEFMAMLPDDFQQSSSYNSVMAATGNEFDSLQSEYEFAYDQVFYQTATWGLFLHERMNGLLENPSGLTYDQRRSLIAAKKNAKAQKLGKSLVDAIQLIIPFSSVKFDRADKQLQIIVPLTADAYLQNQIETMLAQTIPAHIKYNVEFSAFVAGISKAGDSL